MADEFVFAIDGSHAVPADPITLADAGLREREHLEEWVLKNPQILGPDVQRSNSDVKEWAREGSPG